MDSAERERLLEMTCFEQDCYSKGFQQVAGIDEAGRGPLAGPVFAAACILPRGFLLPGLNDSKKLTARRRDELFSILTTHSDIHYGVGIASEGVIDRVNILEATKLAMQQAVSELKVAPDYLLVDGLKLPHPHLPVQKIIKGDQLSLSIAAASVIAKVLRDRWMCRLHEQFPVYGFNKHAGYGTEAHRKAIELHGPCEAHRKTFEPIKSMISLG